MAVEIKDDFLDCLSGTDTLTHDDYMALRNGQSEGTGSVINSALKNLSIFLKESYDKEMHDAIAALKVDYKNTQSIGKGLALMQNYVNFITTPHPGLMTPANNQGDLRPWVKKSESSTHNYLAQIRLYLMHVAGIYIPADRVAKRITIPFDEEGEEAEALLPSELRRIIDNQGSFRRQMMYRIMKDTCSRIAAMCGLRKRNFDTVDFFESKGKIPIKVIFPAKIMKKKNGKSVTVTKFVSKENEEAILALLERYGDDDLVFVDNENLRLAAKNEGVRWSTLVKKLGFTEVYEHNGRLKKNPHSIKAMTETAAEEAVDEAYANAYGDHKRYLPQYIRWSLEKKVAKFRAMEPLIALYTTKITNDPKIVDENNHLKSKLDSYDVALKKLSEKTKEETSQIPDAKLKKLFEEILRENHVIE